MSAGRKLGRYELTCELATGGMGSVFLARTGSLGFSKLCAVKTIHPHLQKERGFVEMLLDEARIAALISHPNVCQVFDFGVDDGNYYIAMEFLMGESLSELRRFVARNPEVRRDPSHWELTAKIVAEAAQGLHAAHEIKDERGELLNLVHRDVSPQNVFVTYEGAVKVVDFGIARARNRLTTTNSDVIKGKFSYVSPEQIAREELDRRADIWSLGVVLWELLTGQRLFRRGDEIATLRAVAEDPIPKPSASVPTIPIDLDAIVMGALTRDRDRRIATADELARLLQHWLLDRRRVVSMADIATLMQRRFPERHARRLELVEQARQERSSTGVPSASRLLQSDTDSRSVPGPEPTRRRDAAPPRSVAPWLVVGLLAGVAFGASAWFFARQDRPADIDAGISVDAALVELRDAAPPEDAPGDVVMGALGVQLDAGPQPTSRMRTRPRDAAAMSSVPVGTGVVRVQVRGASWARVRIAGRELSAPGVIEDVPAGRQQVVALAPDGTRRTQRVLVRSGASVAVIVDFSDP